MTDAVRKQKIINRNSKNVEGGFWTIGEGDFRKEFLRRIISLNDIKSCLLITDGLDYVIDAEIISFKDITAGNLSLTNIIKMIKSNNKGCIPNEDERVKSIDDIGAILLSIDF